LSEYKYCKGIKLTIAELVLVDKAFTRYEEQIKNVEFLGDIKKLHMRFRAVQRRAE